MARVILDPLRSDDALRHALRVEVQETAQPPGESTLVRMVSPPTPWRSKLRCSSSTRVELLP
jgi:hypothetical protein